MAKPLRFVVVSKVDHPWFDEVYKGAQTQAAILSRETSREISVDYFPPSVADIRTQNSLLQKVAQSQPTGIAIDPVDVVEHLPAIQRLRDQGIHVVLFDSPSPDATITSVGNNFAQQGIIAAERLAKLINYKGKVALMQGYPSAPNHRWRFEAQRLELGNYPNITVVDGGVDNDDIETARHQATSTLIAHPDLSGYLCCDASGPIGIAAAIRQADKIDRVKVVGMDGIRPILDAIKEGVINSSVATMPKMQGQMSILMLWQATMGLPTPQAIDTGIDIITQENVDQFLLDSV